MFLPPFRLTTAPGGTHLLYTPDQLNTTCALNLLLAQTKASDFNQKQNIFADHGSEAYQQGTYRPRPVSMVASRENGILSAASQSLVQSMFDVQG